MGNSDLIREARRAWLEYEDAIVRAFGFPPGSKLVADGLEAALSQASDEKIRQLTKNIRNETENVRKMK